MHIRACSWIRDEMSFEEEKFFSIFEFSDIDLPKLNLQYKPRVP